MGPVGGSSSCQCQGVAGCASRSPPLPVLSVRDHGGRVLQQCHSDPLSTQGGGRPVSCSRHRCPGDPPLGGISTDSTGSPVPSGNPQCSRGLTLPSSPAPQFRMVSQLGLFRSLRRRWPVMFDLCTTSDYHRCSIFFSPYRDPLSAGTDALLQSWDGLLACAFPPWSVLPRVLAKLRVSHRTLLTLIAQYWPQRPWFVDLLQLSVAPPVPLSASPDLLFQPRSRRSYPGLRRLALHAWRLSSASTGRLVSPRRWLRRLRWRAVHHRAPPTSSSGRFTGHGAALRATPSCGHPSPW